MLSTLFSIITSRLLWGFVGITALAFIIWTIGPLVAIGDVTADDAYDLARAGVRLAVATSKAEPTAQRILAHFELDGFFEVIAGASPDGSRAAKHEVVAYALEQLAPLPERPAARRLPAIAAEAKIAAASSQSEALSFLDRAERAALLSDPRLLERWAALPR